MLSDLGLPVMGSYISVILVATGSGCVSKMFIQLGLAESAVTVKQKASSWPRLGLGPSSSGWHQVMSTTPGRHLRIGGVSKAECSSWGQPRRRALLGVLLWRLIYGEQVVDYG